MSTRLSTILACLVFLVAAPVRAAESLFAIVVGVNRPLSPETPKLLYADDDAILFHMLFSRIGKSVLLVEPDESTRKIHGELAGAMRPTKFNLRLAAEQMLAQVRAARDRGEKPQLYFIYSGHGDVKNNEGYLALEGDKLTSEDLAEMLLSRSSAAANHVIIDACKSYFMVHEKRAGGGRRKVGAPFYRSTSLAERFPQTGFLLSTSTASSSHEWEEFGAGIFSHEVRSGLLGAADVNRDGRVSYNEIRAFIDVANAAIVNDRFRPKIYVSPPGSDGTRPLFQVRSGKLDSIVIPPGRAGRYFLEDSLGVRLADLHSDTGGPVEVLLLADQRTYLHDLDRSLEYLSDPQRGQESVLELTKRASTYRSKGAAHEAFAKIFKEPFGPSAYCTALKKYAVEVPKTIGLECVECECKKCKLAPQVPKALDGAMTGSWSEPEPVTSAKPSGRPPWQHLFEVDLGFGFLKRHFSFTDAIDPGPGNVPSYNSPFVPTISLDLAIYPLGLSARHKVLANFEFITHYERALDLKTVMAGYPNEPLPTTWQRLELGLRYRWNILGRLKSPILRAGLGWARESFTIHWTGDIGTVLFPNITYNCLTLNFADLEIPFYQSMRVGIGGLTSIDYRRVFHAGDIERTDPIGYGHSTTHGFDLQLGLYVKLRWVYFKVIGYHRRYYYSFDLKCYTGEAESSCKAAGGAMDVYSGLQTFGGFYF